MRVVLPDIPVVMRRSVGDHWFGRGISCGCGRSTSVAHLAHNHMFCISECHLTAGMSPVRTLSSALTRPSRFNLTAKSTMVRSWITPFVSDLVTREVEGLSPVKTRAYPISPEGVPLLDD